MPRGRGGEHSRIAFIKIASHPPANGVRKDFCRPASFEFYSLREQPPLKGRRIRTDSYKSTACPSLALGARGASKGKCRPTEHKLWLYRMRYSSDPLNSR